MKYTCGIDWASDHHDASIVNERGMEVKRMRIADTLVGYAAVLEELSSRGESIPVSIECKDHLFIEVLMEAGHPVYPINPKSAQRYRDRYNVAGAKTDERDAFALADMLRTDLHKLRPLSHGSREVRKLQLLCKEYETLQHDRNKVQCQVHDLLSRYFPAALTLFTTRACKTQYRLILHYSTYRELKAASFEELSEALRACHCYRRDFIRRVYERVQGSEYASNELYDEVFSQSAVSLCRVVLSLTDAMERLEAQMHEILDAHRLGPIFLSLPGCATLTAARLLAVMGDDKDAFQTAEQVQTYAGLAPVIRRSGKTYRVVFRYACNKMHRDTLTWFAFSSLTHCGWARAYYDAQRARGKRHFQACRALAFKWMRVIFHLWKTEELYDEAHHLAEKRRFEENSVKSA